MKLAIMQPYFFPYIGYFSLMDYADRFIFFDTPQYISKGWVNRNRILTFDGDVTYITVPIKKVPRSTAIKEIVIDNEKNWREKIYGQLTAYKKKAPEYKKTMEFVKNILDNFNGKYLSELNIYATKKIAMAMGIECEFDTFSKMEVNMGEVNAPDEWALEISKALKADIYVNPPGGIEFFEQDKYDANHIELKFLKNHLKPYIQRIGRWEPGLSIIDVMMFCKMEEIRKMIKDYTFL